MFACAVLIANPPRAAAAVDPAERADVSTILAKAFADAKIPGGAAVVMHGDQIVASGATGVRKRGSDVPVTMAHNFHLGSCTKAMTATLAATFVEEGRLKWQSTLGEIFGEVVGDMHPGWREVTVRQILAHRGGFPANLGRGPDARRAAAQQPILAQRRKVVAEALTAAPLNPPGVHVYSNLGYTVVGAALEKLSGRPWEESMLERIFQPLAIRGAGFGAPGTGGKVDQPWGHRGASRDPVDPGLAAADNPKAIGPAGTVHLPLAGWAKFVALHLRGHRGNPRREIALLTDESFTATPRARMSPGAATARRAN